ncbi:MAG: hypothetical protein ABSH20_11260 [Tepidisphaeraceae bacterium]|jgi:hypothetical protein
MKFPLLAAVLLIVARVALADGIPVDQNHTKVTAAHDIVKLNESQIEEVETLGTLTLDPGQWAKLRATNADCPKRFDTVLPITYDDCTCGVGNYVIAVSRDEVAVLRSGRGAKAIDAFIDALSGSGSAGARAPREVDDRAPTPTLLVDHRGQFYYKGILLPFRELLAAVSTTKAARAAKPADENRLIWVSFPVHVGSNSEAIKPRLDKLKEAATAAGWTVGHGDWE